MKRWKFQLETKEEKNANETDAIEKVDEYFEGKLVKIEINNNKMMLHEAAVMLEIYRQALNAR